MWLRVVYDIVFLQGLQTQSRSRGSTTVVQRGSAGLPSPWCRMKIVVKQQRLR